jgi:hypothetical protein
MSTDQIRDLLDQLDEAGVKPVDGDRLLVLRQDGACASFWPTDAPDAMLLLTDASEMVREREMREANGAPAGLQ